MAFKKRLTEGFTIEAEPELPKEKPDSADPGDQVVSELGQFSIDSEGPIESELYKNPKGREICVCFPCHKATNFVTSAIMVALALDYGRERIRFEFVGGDAMIYKARNRLADAFMASGSDWLLFLDDDIIPPIGRAGFIRQHTGITPDQIPDAVLNRNFLDRLLSHGKSLVGGTYFGRHSVASAMYREAVNSPEEDRRAHSMPDELKRTDWVGTGCMLVNRQVFLDIQTAYPELAPNEVRNYWNYFLNTSEDGEDVAFCRRAKQVGHDAYVDLGIQCLHVGYCCYGPHNTRRKGGLFD